MLFARERTSVFDRELWWLVRWHLSIHNKGHRAMICPKYSYNLP